MRGKRAFVGSDLRELIDLYRWGARMSDICIIYDVHKQTVTSTLRMNGVTLRRPYRAPMAQPQRDDDTIKSSRPQIPAGARLVDGDQAPDQLLRSSAHALRDKRTAARLADASKHSCPEAVS